VNHYWHPELLEHFAGKAYFSGHIHTGRYKNKALNTAFLYRTADHGADALFGAYFVVEIASDGTWQVDFRNIGQVRKGSVPSIRHSVYSSSRTTGDRTVSSATTKTISTVRWFAQHSTDWEQYKRKPRLTKL